MINEKIVRRSGTSTMSINRSILSNNHLSEDISFELAFCRQSSAFRASCNYFQKWWDYHHLLHIKILLIQHLPAFNHCICLIIYTITIKYMQVLKVIYVLQTFTFTMNICYLHTINIFYLFQPFLYIVTISYLHTLNFLYLFQPFRFTLIVFYVIIALLHLRVLWAIALRIFITTTRWLTHHLLNLKSSRVNFQKHTPHNDI